MEMEHLEKLKQLDEIFVSIFGDWEAYNWKIELDDTMDENYYRVNLNWDYYQDKEKNRSFELGFKIDDKGNMQLDRGDNGYEDIPYIFQDRKILLAIIFDLL